MGRLPVRQSEVLCAGLNLSRELPATRYQGKRLQQVECAPPPPPGIPRLQTALRSKGRPAASRARRGVPFVHRSPTKRPRRHRPRSTRPRPALSVRSSHDSAVRCTSSPTYGAQQGRDQPALPRLSRAGRVERDPGPPENCHDWSVIGPLELRKCGWSKIFAECGEVSSAVLSSISQRVSRKGSGPHPETPKQTPNPHQMRPLGHPRQRPSQKKRPPRTKRGRR